MSAPSNVCGMCLGSGEVFQVRSVIADGSYRTVQGFVACPQCGDPDGPVALRPTAGRPRRSLTDP